MKKIKEDQTVFDDFMTVHYMGFGQSLGPCKLYYSTYPEWHSFPNLCKSPEVYEKYKAWWKAERTKEVGV